MVGIGRASGKVILLGEHAVVYGVPALAAGLERGATARATEATADRISFSGSELPAEHELYRALATLRSFWGFEPVDLELELEVPAGSGLGGSAALGTATARALLDLHHKEITNGELTRAVTQWEKIFHGNPSGIDAAASRTGGVLRYVRGEEPDPVPLRRPFTLALTVAGPPASTKEMVEGVARLRERKPESFDKTLAAISALVENAILCLRAGDLPGLGRLMDLNQMLLGSWMVSTPGIELACRAARDSGALGAKLTGSGGGGTVIALAQDDPEPILAAWRALGLTAFACEIGKNSS